MVGCCFLFQMVLGIMRRVDLFEGEEDSRGVKARRGLKVPSKIVEN